MYKVVYQDGSWLKGNRGPVEMLVDAFENFRQIRVLEASEDLKHLIGKTVNVPTSVLKYWGRNLK